MNDNALLKWKEYFQDNKKILKELSKLENIKIEETDFFNPLQIIDERFLSKIGIGLNKLNQVTIRALASMFINENNLDENDLVLVASDGTKECVDLIKSLAFLELKKGKLITFEQYEGVDKKIVNESFKKIKMKIGIYIQQSTYNPMYYDVFLLNDKGENFDHEYIKNILRLTHQNDYFLTKIIETDEMLFIETPIIIKMFVKKILPLYTKKISTNKTKIAISNHNKNVTEIISKIFGNLDFSYVVNNKVKSVLPVYKNDKMNDTKIRRIFRSEIRFAKSKKANVLISFSNNGSQLFCFVKIKNRFVYINENLITLLVLNNFFNDVIVNNKKIPKFYIGSNNYLNKPIQNLVNKFHVDFKLTNDSNLTTESYLLFYWNNYNQFAFGEKNNKTFSIYHILIKLIEIINIFNLQFGGIESILYDLNHMYSSSYETKYYSSLPKNKVITILENISKHNEYELSKKYKFKQIENNINHIDLADEIIISNIKLTNNDDLIIKWNNITNKVIFIHRYDQKRYNIFHLLNPKHISIKKIIKLFIE